MNASDYQATIAANSGIPAPPCPFCETGEVDSDGYCAECGLLRVGGEEVKIEPVALPAGEILALFAIGAGAIDARGPGAAIELPAGTYAVGRADADIVVPDPYVSRAHAEIAVAADGITVTDLGSANGTFVGDVRLQANAPRKLTLGESLRFGKTNVAWEFLGGVDGSARVQEPLGVHEAETADDSTETSPDFGFSADAPEREGGAELPDADSPDRSLCAEKVDDANAANETDDAKAFRETGWILKFANRDIADAPLAHGKTAIGRKAGRADVVIQGDGYISSAHVSVEINDDGVYVTDLNSTNGTFIGETRLDPLVPIKVESGARIRIGETEFEIVHVDADSAETGDSQSDAVETGGSTDAGDSKDAEESPEAG